MLLKLNPTVARVLIGDREPKRDLKDYKFESLESTIQEGNWDDVDPIWVSPNILINSVLSALYNLNPIPILQPLLMYNGHHRLRKAIEHGLPIKAYLRYTPGNPKMPEHEKLQCDYDD